MIAHARKELLALAESCVIESLGTYGDWTVDAWNLGPAEIAHAHACYDAILRGYPVDDQLLAALRGKGIDVKLLLVDDENKNDQITRSDIVEMIAAASLLATDSCDLDNMHMPNIPKMSRRKSDSGIDITDLVLRTDEPRYELLQPDFLRLASVKHSVAKKLTGLRQKLTESLGPRELSKAYLVSQMRVIIARSVDAGMDEEVASRLFLFLPDFPNAAFTKLYAFAAVESERREEFMEQLVRFRTAPHVGAHLRVLLVPGLNDLHVGH